MLKSLLLSIGIFSIIGTLLPLSKSPVWWVRIFDFPRLQLTFLALLSLLTFSISCSSFELTDHIFIATLAGCIFYQSVKILPYTFLFSKKVLQSERKNNHNDQVSLLVTNVLMTNRESQKCLNMIRKADPDLILAVETDKWWEKELKILEDFYPYRSYAPLANTYGMLLFSKLKLLECEIKYLFDHNIPSVHCTIQLPSGSVIKFFGVHPKPPAPGQSSSSVHRDAELIIVGKEAKSSHHPVIVAGDLNDVAWSYTTHLFQKISGLLDPRVGRGLFPTYNSKYPLFRWPLDHVFHSTHFKLVELKRLENIGSDHFPIYIKLSYEPEEKEIQEEPEATVSEKVEAKKKIEQAK